jgi:hypothetical protein
MTLLCHTRDIDNSGVICHGIRWKYHGSKFPINSKRLCNYRSKSICDLHHITSIQSIYTDIMDILLYTVIYFSVDYVSVVQGTTEDEILIITG